MMEWYLNLACATVTVTCASNRDNDPNTFLDYTGMAHRIVIMRKPTAKMKRGILRTSKKGETRART